MAAPSTLTIWLVEDSPRYRTTMATILDSASRMECKRTFGASEALLDALERVPASGRPDVLLLDIHLPGKTGVEALPEIRATAPDTSVVMLTIAEDDDLIFEAFQSGASGYLLKDSPVDDILEAIRQTAVGGTLMPAPVADSVLAYFRNSSSNEYALTPREREVLRLMTEGLSQREIAERLFVSPHTINTHVQHLYAKLQVNSGIEAVVKAVRERLV